MQDQVDKLRRRLKFFWFWLGFCTLVSITLNVWHAMSIAPDPELTAQACQVSAELCAKARHVASDVVGLHPVLGLIFAIVPPILAAALSDALVDPVVGIWPKVVILFLFFMTMATSIVSQALVLHPYGGGYNAEWSVPLGLDATAMICLHMIIKIKKMIREAIEKASAEADMAALRKAVEVDIRPDIEEKARLDMQVDMERTLATMKVDMEVDMERTLSQREVDIRAAAEVDMERKLKVALADIEESLAAREAELETAAQERLAAAEARLAAELEVKYAARSRPVAAPETPAKASKPSAAAAASGSQKVELTSKERVKLYLAEKPDATHKEIAEGLSVDTKTVQRAIRALEAEGVIEPSAGGRVIALRVAQ